MTCRTHDQAWHRHTETIIYDYGTSAFLSRLSDTFWFFVLIRVYPVHPRLKALIS
jgi:hypothetical protein